MTAVGHLLSSKLLVIHVISSSRGTKLPRYFNQSPSLRPLSKMDVDQALFVLFLLRIKSKQMIAYILFSSCMFSNSICFDVFFSPNDITEGTVDEHNLMIYVSLLRSKVFTQISC